MTVRVTVHPGEDVALSDGVPPAAFREPLAALLRRPELRHADLFADGAPLPEECRAGERPLLPGATLTTGSPDAGTTPGRALNGATLHDDAPAGSRPSDITPPDTAAILRTPWMLARTTGPAAGGLVPVSGPRELLRSLRSLIGASIVHPARAAHMAGRPHRRSGLRLRRGGTSTILAPPRPPSDTLWLLSLLPVLASVGLAALLRQPALALFALVGLATLIPQIRRRRTAPRTAPGGDRPHRAGPDALLAYVIAAQQAAPGTWRAARSAWTEAPAHPGWPGGAWDDLLGDGALAILGPEAHTRAVARAIVADLAARGQPVRVLGAVRHWAWCRWLGATDLPSTTPRHDPAEPGHERADPSETPGESAPAPVLVVDHGTAGDHASARRAAARGDLIIVLGATHGCRTVVRARGERLRVTGPEAPHRARPLVGVTVEWAERYARLLAGARYLGRTPGDLTGGTRTTTPTAARLPDDVPLTSLHDVDGLPVGRTGSRSGSWAVPIGRTTTGTVTWNLVTDGPHLLVAGTTGSGKSELLRALVLGLALQHPPGHLMLGLIDFKGGAGLQELTGLPHVVGQVTDLDATLAARALAGLQAELRRRKTLLAEHGVADVAALAPGAVPRLVVVVDEFRALADELPELLPGLVRIAAQGRSLGVHLVLTTQRPAGAVSADMRANVTARLALRVTDPLESRDVVDCPDAAALPVDRPGRAVLRIGSGTPLVVQCAHTGAARQAAPVRRASSFDRNDVRPAHPVPPEAVPGSPSTGSAGLVAAIRTAYGGTAPHAPLWLPPLPERVTFEDLRDRDGHPDGPGLLLALGDLPDQPRRAAVRWDPAEGNLAVLGRARTGRTNVLAVLAAGARARGMTVQTVTPASAPASSPGTDLLLIDDLDAVRATYPGWMPPPGVPLAVTARGSVAAPAYGIGPCLVMLSRDRTGDVALGAPVALAGSGGVPGRAAWSGRTGTLLCQVVLCPALPPKQPQ